MIRFLLGLVFRGQRGEADPEFGCSGFTIPFDYLFPPGS